MGSAASMGVRKRRRRRQCGFLPGGRLLLRQHGIPNAKETQALLSSHTRSSGQGAIPTYPLNLLHHRIGIRNSLPNGLWLSSMTSNALPTCSDSSAYGVERIALIWMLQTKLGRNSCCDDGDVSGGALSWCRRR